MARRDQAGHWDGAAFAAPMGGPETSMTRAFDAHRAAPSRAPPRRAYTLYSIRPAHHGGHKKGRALLPVPSTVE